MELSELAIGGVSIGLLVPGLVEFSKKLGLKGPALVMLAFALGAAFAGVWGAMDLGLVPERVVPWIRVAALALGGGVVGLSLTGYYDLGQRALGSLAGRAAFPPEEAHKADRR